MVGATEVIVGNAPMELSGVAGGLQQAAMQIGGEPRYGPYWCRDGVQGRQRPGRQLGGRRPSRNCRRSSWARPPRAVQVGVAPVAEGMPEQMAAKVTEVAHDTFISGMSLASLVAAGVAAVAVLVAFLTKRGENAEAGAGVGHI